MTDIDELEQLAKEATPGPWHCGIPKFDYKESCGYWMLYIPLDTSSMIGHNPMPNFPIRELPYGHQDSEYIAAANPAAVLELCAEISKLRSIVEIDNAKLLPGVPLSEYKQLEAEVERLREALRVYADDDNWMAGGESDCGFPYSYTWEGPDNKNDPAKIARTALEAMAANGAKAEAGK